MRTARDKVTPTSNKADEVIAFAANYVALEATRILRDASAFRSKVRMHNVRDIGEWINEGKDR